MRTGALKISQGKLSVESFYCCLHQFRFCPSRTFNAARPVFKLPIGGLEDKQEIVDIGPGIMFPVMPAVRALLQRFVIAVFVLLDKPLKADIAPHLITKMVTLQ